MGKVVTFILMQRLLFILLLLPVFTPQNANAQGWQWGRELYSLGSTRVVNGYVTKADLCNNVYVAGIWKSDSITIGTVTYYNHHVGVNNYEAYFAKYDSTGILQWSSASILGQALPYDITTDNDGNVYLYGCFWTDSVMFGTHLLVNNHMDSCYYPWCAWGAGCYFIIKYDPLGNIIWARSGDNVRQGGGITIDAAANLYITGAYWNVTMVIGSDTLYNASYRNADAFIAKYDSSGNVIWAKSYGGIYNDYSYKIAQANNRIYITGSFLSPTMSFGSTTLTYHSSIPLDSIGVAFIAQFDTAGNNIWAKCSVGSAYPYGIATDNANGVYIGGEIYDTLFASFATDTLRGSTLDYAGFLTKYDTAGNVVWLKEILNRTATVTSGNEGDKVWAVATDPCNNIWISGQISGDTGGIFIDTGIILHAPTGSVWPLYLVGYNSNGGLLQYLSLPTGASNGGSWGLCSDNTGHLYLSSNDGLTSDTLVFATDTINRHSGTVMFLAKYNPNLGCSNINCGSSIGVNPITGHTSFCFGIAKDTLSNATASGIWSSSNTAVATVGSSTGIVTGVGIGVVTITYTVGSSYVTMQDTVKICEGGVSLLGSNGGQIMIYPNPATKELVISSSDKITSVAITNLLGQTMYSQQYSSPQIQVDVSDLPAGMYLVRINGTEVRKFVKE